MNIQSNIQQKYYYKRRPPYVFAGIMVIFAIAVIIFTFGVIGRMPPVPETGYIFGIPIVSDHEIAVIRKNLEDKKSGLFIINAAQDENGRKIDGAKCQIAGNANLNPAFMQITKKEVDNTITENAIVFTSIKEKEGVRNSYVYFLDYNFNSLTDNPIEITNDAISNPTVLENRVFTAGTKKTYILDTTGIISEYQAIPDEETDEINTTVQPGDIDNDGNIEMVFGTKNGKIYTCLYNEIDGWQLKDGFPVSIGTSIAGISILDLENDGDAEIIVLSGGKLYILKNTGEQLENSPLRAVKPITEYSIGETDIVVINENNEMSIYTADDILYNREPAINSVELNEPVVRPPLFADLNNDGYKEIVLAFENRTAAYDTQSNIFLDDWNINFGENKVSELAVVDLNNDGLYELAVLLGNGDLKIIYTTEAAIGVSEFVNFEDTLDEVVLLSLLNSWSLFDNFPPYAGVDIKRDDDGNFVSAGIKGMQYQTAVKLTGEDGADLDIDLAKRPIIKIEMKTRDFFYIYNCLTTNLPPPNENMFMIDTPDNGSRDFTVKEANIIYNGIHTGLGSELLNGEKNKIIIDPTQDFGRAYKLFRPKEDKYFIFYASNADVYSIRFCAGLSAGEELTKPAKTEFATKQEFDEDGRLVKSIQENYSPDGKITSIYVSDNRSYNENGFLDSYSFSSYNSADDMENNKYSYRAEFVYTYENGKRTIKIVGEKKLPTEPESPSEPWLEKVFEGKGVIGGILVTDGKYLYITKWPVRSSGRNAFNIIGSGFGETTAGKNYGTIKIPDDIPAFISAVYYEGYIYIPNHNNPYEVIGINIENGKTIKIELKQDEGMIARDTGLEERGLQLITSDGRFVYNTAFGVKGDAYAGWTIRIFDPQENWRLIKEIAIDGISHYTNGILCKDNYIYAIEWNQTDNALITKIKIPDESAVNQWQINQGTRNVISGQYDPVNKKFWLTALSGPNIHMYGIEEKEEEKIPVEYPERDKTVYRADEPVLEIVPAPSEQPSVPAVISEIPQAKEGQPLAPVAPVESIGAPQPVQEGVVPPVIAVPVAGGVPAAPETEAKPEEESAVVVPVLPDLEKEKKLLDSYAKEIRPEREMVTAPIYEPQAEPETGMVPLDTTPAGEPVSLGPKGKNNPPVLDHIGDKTAFIGTPLVFIVTATDIERGELVFSAEPLSKNAVFNSKTGYFSWTPDIMQEGRHNITFSVTDGDLKDTEDIYIDVVSSYKEYVITFEEEEYKKKNELNGIEEPFGVWKGKGEITSPSIAEKYSMTFPEKRKTCTFETKPLDGDLVALILFFAQKDREYARVDINLEAKTGAAMPVPIFKVPGVACDVPSVIHKFTALIDWIENKAVIYIDNSPYREFRNIRNMGYLKGPKVYNLSFTMHTRKDGNMLIDDIHFLFDIGNSENYYEKQ